ncbi:MAG: single-stranded-DNA-specific exonuclease RecJ [Verrucomicrobiales bacterium]|nr:single-stranded-DNA-specific exonuclease RecJ [Verrucomicrobiales bacterium]
MPSKTKWIVEPEPDPDLVRELVTEFGLSEIVVRLAIQRGFTEREEFINFLYPRLKDLSDPFNLHGIAAAVERILRAADDNESVVLFGDYDVDGVSSVALLTKILQGYGIEPRSFLPTRLKEGYGLSTDGLEKSFEGNPPDLVIAADCGTNSREEATYLKEKGIDLIILDHHEPSPEGVAECDALVNPKLGEDYHYLCTGGVVFKVGHALLKTRPVPGMDLKEFLDFVALATIADIVPLVEENRIFARKGLIQLDRTIHPGLAALKDVANVSIPAKSFDVSHKLGPRLNASGRLDTAKASLDLVLCEDPVIAKTLAEDLDLQNKERQELEFRTREEAEQMILDLPPDQRSYGIVVGSRGWHPGVVGIVASRISKFYHRPTFIIAIDDEGLGKGSGRSVPGISLVDALNDSRDIIEAGGGHEMAAGVTVMEDNIEAFRKRFDAKVKEQATSDSLVSLADVKMELLDSYELLHPFGASNPQPLFMAKGVEMGAEPRIIKEKHMKFQFYQDGVLRDAIYFNSADLDLPNPPWDIAFNIDRNEFRGLSQLSITLQAVRKAGG